MKESIQIHSDLDLHPAGVTGGDLAGASLHFRESSSGQVGPRRSPLRVLHVINSLNLGGTERGVLKLMHGLSPDLFEQNICAIRGADPSLLESSHLGEKVGSLEEKSAGFQFLLFRLMRILREFRPHIVHSRNWGAIEMIPAGWLARVPVIIHSEHGYDLDMLSGLPLHRRVLRRAVYPLCDAVFTVSRELQEYHGQQSWFPTSRIRVISNGVDTDLFTPNSETRHRIREEFQYSPDTIVLGTIGRMVPIKHQKALLESAERLIQRKFNVEVLMVGAGTELPALQSYAKASPVLGNRVRFLGQASQVRELFLAMDIFVLPSITEGMSNTLLEAMASRLACVATRVGGNPELIEDVHSGFLFEPRDVTGLTARLEQLILDPNRRAQVAAAARCRVETHFSLERMMESYTSLYVDLAAQRGLVPRN